MFATVRESLEYADRLRDLFGSSVIAQNPIWEGGGDKAYDISGHGCHGIRSVVAVAPGIGDGRFSGSFNGTTSFINWYTPALAAAFDGQNFTLAGWFENLSWTDGVLRVGAQIGVNASNITYISKNSTNNQWRFTYIAGGTTVNVIGASGAPSGLVHVAITASLSDNHMTAYVSGVQFGTAQTPVGTWAGSLSSTLCCIGSSSTTPANVTNGRSGHWILLNRAATSAEIAAAYNARSA